MYVTGRLPLLVALGAVPVVLLSSAGVDAGARGVGLGRAVHPAGARGCRRRTRSARGATSSARSRAACSSGRARSPSCGCATPVRGRVRGRVRDAWQPTAGAPAGPPADQRSRRARAGSIAIPLLPRRRGELTSRFVVLRSDGPLRTRGPAAPGRLGRRHPRAAALHRAPAPALASRATARARRQHERAGARAGHRVRQPARVRARRRRALDRLACDRAVRRRRCCAPGAPSATGTS